MFFHYTLLDQGKEEPSISFKLFILNVLEFFKFYLIEVASPEEAASFDEASHRIELPHMISRV